MSDRKLNILLVSAEVAPFAKVGGLADVAGALPKALKALGHDVRVAMPCYRMIEDNPAYGVTDELPWFPVPINDHLTEQARVRRTSLDGDIPVYLVGGERHFTEATESRKVYTLDPEPYVFFDRAVAEFVPRLSPEWVPDVVHCNDWHTGLLPIFLDLLYRDHPTWRSAGRVFTVHNLAYQGDYPYSVLEHAGLPSWTFTFDRLEFYGRMSFMKGGLVYSDYTNTVSRTYAQEIQTPEFGCRLEGMLRHLQAEGRLSGIVNGIDYAEYNPETDPRIPAHFSADDARGKARCKAALQAECGLPKSRTAAVIGIVSRLADQKGFDLIRECAERMLALPVQIVLLGTGDPECERFFRALQENHPRKVRAFIDFNADLAQRIYAGSDLFLMPSRFEPCGLGQLMSLRYGTIPIVRATGGLADTIEDVSDAGDAGNGFSFRDYSAGALMATVDRAVEAYRDRDNWRRLVERALREDNSWTHSAASYVDLYRHALECARLSRAA